MKNYSFLKPLFEKQAVAKIGLLALLLAINIGIMMGIAFVDMLTREEVRTSFGTTTYESSPMIVLLYCLTYILMIPVYFVQYRYMFEYTFAGTRGAESVAIWKEEFMTDLKKAGKAFLGHLIHTLIMLIPLALGACALFFFVIAVGSSNPDAWGIAIIAFLCFGLLALTIYSFLYYFYVFYPCFGYAIYTGKFSNIVNLGKAREFISKDWATYNDFVLKNVLIGVAVVVAYFVSLLSKENISKDLE